MAKTKFKKLKKVKLIPTPKAAVIGFFCVLFVLFAVYLGKELSSSSIFMVKELRSNVAIDNNAITLTGNESLFDVDLEGIRAQIYRQHPEYKEVYLSKEFPSAVRITIVIRKPFALLKGDKNYPVDREGVVITEDQSAAPGFVLIEIDDYNRRLKPGQRVADVRLETAFVLIEELYKARFLRKFSVQSINATQPEVMCMMIDQTKIILGKNDFKRKLGTLETILRGELKGDLALVEYIDLRYDKVYLGRKR
ncbi:MAG: cell division protein FtsQ/DivIB [Candidatus Omnitrophota bacterium]|nr:cell division protein FtsQ/DivIB [Candidatus Omnitrophota bacterium]